MNVPELSIAMPARRWVEQRSSIEVIVPTVLISSYDRAPVPDVAGARRLEAAAEAAGWQAMQTYALAAVPDHPRKPAHRLASVAVWLRRGQESGWAVWTKEDEHGWRFARARLGRRGAYGIRALIEQLKEH